MPLVLQLLIAYLAAGTLTAIAFACCGVTRLMPGARVSLGARLLLMPGAFLLWPLVVKRWLSGASSHHDA